MTTLYLPRLCGLHLCNVKSRPVPPYLVARPPVSSTGSRGVQPCLSAPCIEARYRSKVSKQAVRLRTRTPSLPAHFAMAGLGVGRGRPAAMSAFILITPVPCPIPNHPKPFASRELLNTLASLTPSQTAPARVLCLPTRHYLGFALERRTAFAETNSC